LVKPGLTIKYLLFFLALSLYSFSALPQEDCRAISSAEVRLNYDSLFRIDPILVSGDFFLNPPMSPTAGHPFFIGPEWKNGSVYIGGTAYDSLLIRYDVSINKLILNTLRITNSYIQIALNSHLIDSFTLDYRIFKPFPVQKSETVRFCEVLTGAPATLLILRTKTLKVPTDGSSRFAYQTSEKRILLSEDRMIPYRGRRTLYQLFPEQRNNLRDYIRQEKLRFGRQQIESHVRLIDHCNFLANKSR